ncbi:MAG TPA: thioredoxin domain-containing protein [Methylovirgula sp.]|nr:thioredoxin domain-containing protein [Methylovirgula sp.]
MSFNELTHAASPYLLQHATNPVHWRMWGPAALQEAQEKDKPILLSVGYAACHWCHVMAHESFEDPDIAAVMNELFVNIKVDREERPDIDHIYMSALHAFGERGGWPMTMFLTPTGEAFWGGTYFPKHEQYGRPAFVDVLRSVARAYRADPGRITSNAKIIRDALAQVGSAGGDPLRLATVDTLAAQLVGHIDPVNGGLRGAPKFPNPPILELLWRAGTRLDQPSYLELVELTLTRMARGGIYDHLGGGFSRYSVDERWLVPHFEKMLYDNAQILELLALCAQRTGNDLLRLRARETIAWLEREMMDGAFCASLDADSEGEEGKFYTWTWSELVALLGEEDASYFAQFYGVTPQGNWHEGGPGANILNQLDAKAPSAADEARLAPLKAKLLAARQKRIPPARDDKILADWNGLMIAALVHAGTALNEPRWIALAARAYHVLVEKLDYTDAAGARRLAHGARAGIAVRPGFALDHAAMMRAALALHEVRDLSGAELSAHDYLADTIAWARAIEAHHIDSSGLVTMSADDASDVILRLAPTHDDAIPNAHSIYLDALVRLAAASGDETWLARADSLFATLAGVVRANPVGHAGILNALDLRLRGLEIVVTGPARQALYETALSIPFDERIVVSREKLDDIPPTHPAAGQKTDGATAFVCSAGTCSLPVHDPAALRITAETRLSGP